MFGLFNNGGFGDMALGQLNRGQSSALGGGGMNPGTLNAIQQRLNGLGDMLSDRPRGGMFGGPEMGPMHSGAPISGLGRPTDVRGFQTNQAFAPQALGMMNYHNQPLQPNALIPQRKLQNYAAKSLLG